MWIELFFSTQNYWMNSCVHEWKCIKSLSIRKSLFSWRYQSFNIVNEKTILLKLFSITVSRKTCFFDVKKEKVFSIQLNRMYID